MKSILAIPADKISIIPNGIEEIVSRESREEWRKRHGFTGDAFLACMAANLHRYKDHQTLIAAWKIVLGKTPHDNCWLLLAGKPGDTYEQLQQQVQAAGLSGRVRFLGSVKDMHSLLKAVDLSVLSTFSEGLPNAVLEAMAAGLPVLATDEPACRQALGNTMEKCLFPVGDASILAEKILRLLHSKTYRQELGNENKIRLEREFSVQKLWSSTALLLQKALKKL